MQDIPTEGGELDLDDDEDDTVDIVRKQHQETDEEFERELKVNKSGNSLVWEMGLGGDR